jgi:hypothetical protein
MINLQELLGKLSSGEIPTASKFDLMNERRQEIQRGMIMPRLRYSFRKRSRVCFLLQLAIPFDPATGEVSEDFNPEKKWRPALSVRSAALVVKTYASQSDTVRKKFASRAGLPDWDVSEPEILNPQDFEVLHSYRVPFIFTTEVVTINDSCVTGNEFAVDYAVDVKRDLDTGKLIGKLPKVALFGNLVSDITGSEVRELRSAMEKKDPGAYKGIREFINPASIPSATEDMRKEWIRKIFQSAIMSEIRPANYFIALEFPLSDDQTMFSKAKEPLPGFVTLQPEAIKACLRYGRWSTKYKNFVETALKSDSSGNFWDFIEADLCDSTLVEPTEQAAKAEAARQLNPSTCAHGFYNIDTGRSRAPWVDELCDAIADYRDSDTEIEQKLMPFLASIVRTLDDNVMNALSARIAEKIPLTSRYITSELLVRHKQTLLLIYGPEYSDLVMERDDLRENSSISDAPKAASVDELIAEAQEEVEEEADALIGVSEIAV